MAHKLQLTQKYFVTLAFNTVRISHRNGSIELTSNAYQAFRKSIGSVSFKGATMTDNVMHNALDNPEVAAPMSPCDIQPELRMTQHPIP